MTMALVLPTATVTISVSADNAPLNSNDATKKIHICADRLISDNNAGYADFTGNVRAVQGDTVITSDNLKIFYDKSPGERKKVTAGKESIKKMVAKGNVKIKLDGKLAVSEHAVYLKATNVLILTGANSKITSYNQDTGYTDYISGNKITLNRADGCITVESSGEKRVEAEFHQHDKGSD